MNKITVYATLLGCYAWNLLSVTISQLLADVGVVFIVIGYVKVAKYAFFFRTGHFGSAIINATVLVYLKKPVQWQMELKHCRMSRITGHKHTSIEPYSCLIVIPREIFRNSSHLIVTRTWNNVDLGN